MPPAKPPQRSLNVQTYIDARVMADLVKVFQETQIPHKGSYSFVFCRILEATHKQWACSFFTETEKALSYLADQGFSVAQMKGAKTGKKLLVAMNKEALLLEEESESQEVEEKATDRGSEIASMFGREPSPEESQSHDS